MRVIGLTGSIACGKSNVSSALSEMGAAVVDGDLLSRRLTAPMGKALPAIRKAFGEGVFLADGTLDRRALGRVVFADGAARAVLDDIMQPMIYETIVAEMTAARTAGYAVCVLDMPLLFEKNLDRLCDRVWCVYLPREKQAERLMARDGCTRAEAEMRMASQLSGEEKAARAEVIIDTGGTLEETRALIPALYEEELRLARAPGGE